MLCAVAVDFEVVPWYPSMLPYRSLCLLASPSRLSLPRQVCRQQARFASATHQLIAITRCPRHLPHFPSLLSTTDSVREVEEAPASVVDAPSTSVVLSRQVLAPRWSVCSCVHRTFSNRLEPSHSLRRSSSRCFWKVLTESVDGIKRKAREGSRKCQKERCPCCG